MSKKKPVFDRVDTKVDFPKMEEKLLDHWYRSGVVEKYLSKNKSSKKYYSFMDGPITANNPMGVHHAWGRTYKDLWQRYKNMQGYKQRFQNGFDCQGLWVEVEVEKELGFKNKKDIEKYGVNKFVKRCKERVEKYAKVQTDQSKRLGYFMDWDNSYYTMSDENNYTIWHFLKVCYENGWLYKGKESVPWCPRCETAISQHEMLTEDYKEVTHKSVFFKLPIIGNEGEFIMVWTTTPWTIPANIAVAVDKEMDYSLVENGPKEKYWIATDAIDQIFGKEIKTIMKVKGSKLVGLKYESPYDHLPEAKKVAKKFPNKFHVVIETDDRIMPISSSEGTGFVHTAVSAGTEDFRLGKKLGLPMIPVIDDDASYLDGLGDLTGKNAKKHPEIILDFMESEGWVFEVRKYKHRYPGCWRCKAELVWKVTDEWYIAMDKKSIRDKKDGRTLRKRMIEVAKKINWIPEFGLKRELDWLNNMQDWLISKKNRYWGLALPIWECTKCNYFEVVGSKDELKEKATKGWSEFEGKGPHKPQIDKVLLDCPKCRGKMNRIEPVGNPWLDAGIVSFSTIKKGNKGSPLYEVDREQWEKWFPADYITESFPGQFKNWFYSLIAMSTVLEDREPTKTVLGFATLLAEDGRPMHKSWGNAIEFNEGASKIGVDVMRWMYVGQNPTDNLLFGYKAADDARRRFILKVWNVYNFFTTYANINNWSPSKGSENKSKNVLDIWILDRLTETSLKVTNALEAYNAFTASGEIEMFVDDLSNWYIRRSRERLGIGQESKEDANWFYDTTFLVLVHLSKLLAPFTPYISDVIYTNLTKKESVHLADWVETEDTDTIDAGLLNEMALARSVVEKAHSERKLAQIPVRRPLLSFSTNATGIRKEIEMIIKEELNVKNVNWGKLKGKETIVEIDTKVTPEIEQEAKTRELIRQIQQERKKIGVELTDKIVVLSPWLPVDKNLIDTIKLRTIASKITKGKFSVKKCS